MRKRELHTAASIKLSLLFWLTALCGLASAQDSCYVQKYDNILNVKGILYNDGLTFRDKGSGLNYIPDLHSGVGIGVFCKYFPFDFSIRKEISLIGNDKFNKQKTTDMQLKGYTKFFAGDIFIQKYSGFYTSEDMKFSSKYNKFDELVFNPDLSVFQIDAVGKYIFNHDKFSYKAGFTAYDRQVISAGSFTAGASLNYLKISADSILVRVEDSKHIKACNIGLNAGYAYNLVFGKRSTWFVSGLAGLNASNLFSRLPSDANEIHLSPSLHIKSAYWLNYDKWSFGITYTDNLVHQTFDEKLTIYLNSRRIEMLVLRRLWNPSK